VFAGLQIQEERPRSRENMPSRAANFGEAEDERRQNKLSVRAENYDGGNDRVPISDGEK